MALPIRPKDLPAGSPNDTAAVPFDTGTVVQKATPIGIVNAATPLASQAEAEAGSDNAKRVTPLRVKQAVVAYGVTATVADGASRVNYADPAAPAYLKTVSDIINGLSVSVFRFIPTGLALPIVARTNAVFLDEYLGDALASGVVDLLFPAGRYDFEESLAISTARQAIEGRGWQRSELRIHSTTDSAVTLANGLAGYSVKGFTVSRVGTPVAGAVGVECLGTTDDSVIEGIDSIGHYDGFVIGTCDTGHMARLRARQNLRDGVRQSNSASYGPSQWDVDDVLCDRNGRDGWRVAVTDGPAGLIMGEMRNLRTFANWGRGFNAIGSATTGVYDLRGSGWFCGSDGYASARLDTHGGKHRLSGFFERNGRDPTGPTLGTPATNQGIGIEITANNSDVIIYGSTIDDNAYEGIQHQGGQLTVSASHIYNNGQALVANHRNGITSDAGRLVVGADVVRNLGSNTTQLYGVAANHDDVIIVGNDMAGNTTQATTLGGFADAIVLGNTPTSEISHLSTGLNVGNATGSTTQGDVNVSANIRKNGTAYTNP